MSFAAARCGSASRGGRGSRRAAIGRAAIGHMAIGQTSRSADQELVDSYHAIHLGETSEERSSRLDNPPDNVCDAVMRLNTGDSYLTPSVNFASQTPSSPPPFGRYAASGRFGSGAGYATAAGHHGDSLLTPHSRAVGIIGTGIGTSGLISTGHGHYTRSSPPRDIQPESELPPSKRSSSGSERLSGGAKSTKKAKLSGSNDNDVDDYIPVTDKSTNNNMDEDGGMSQDGELLRQAIERHRKAFMDKAFPSFGVSDANDDNESSFSVGDSVQITGLDINPEYNDMRGIIISDIDHATNRCGVRIPAIRKVLGLKVDNLRMICEAKKSSSGDTISYTSTKQMSASMTTCRSQKDLDYVVEVVTGWQVGRNLKKESHSKDRSDLLAF